MRIVIFSFSFFVGNFSLCISDKKPNWHLNSWYGRIDLILLEFIYLSCFGLPAVAKPPCSHILHSCLLNHLPLPCQGGPQPHLTCGAQPTSCQLVIACCRASSSHLLNHLHRHMTSPDLCPSLLLLFLHVAMQWCHAC